MNPPWSYWLGCFCLGDRDRLVQPHTLSLFEGGSSYSLCVLRKSKSSGLLRRGNEKAKYNQKMDPEERNILVVAYLGTCDTLETGKEECD